MTPPDYIKCRGVEFARDVSGKWYIWKRIELYPKSYSLWQILWFALTGRGGLA